MNTGLLWIYIHTPADDGPVKFIELTEDNWFMPPGWPETKTFIEILMFPGRKQETKAQLLLEIAAQLSQLLQIEKTDVFITLHEPHLDNWGIAGGKQASQIGVGFKLDV